MRIGSLGGQAGDAHIARKQLVRDFLLLVGDNVGELRGAAAVDHHIHHLGGDIEGDAAVERIFQAAEHRGIEHDDRQVDGKAERADGEARDLRLQQPRAQLRAAGGRLLAQQPAERHAHEHAAVNAAEELIHRLKGADGVDEVDEDRVHRHGEERAHQKALAEALEAHQKERRVEHDDGNADRQRGHKEVDDLRDTGEAAERQLVGRVEPVEGQRHERAAERDGNILFEQLQAMTSFLNPSGISVFRRCPPPLRARRPQGDCGRGSGRGWRCRSPRRGRRSRA